MTTKAGKAAYSKWRMEHAHQHFNIQPGKYGRPMFEHHLDDQILDSLHYAELGLPKTPWKYGILHNCSDDARQQISDKLAEWKHPLDCRRKDDGRSRAQKWFTGEKWATFCAGERGSPGGPIAIATLVLLVAEDMQRNGMHGDGTEAEGGEIAAVPSASAASAGQSAGRGRGRGSGRAGQGGGGRRAGRGRTAFMNRASEGLTSTNAAADDVDVLQSLAPAQLQLSPSAMELQADTEDLAIVRELYGSRAQTLINALLAFDAYFQWYYPMKQSIPFLAPISQREERALSNCRSAIDMHEMFERVSVRNHGSFLPHGAIFKVSRDILRVADVHAVNISPLELLNGETTRTADAGGSRRLTIKDAGETRRPMRGTHEGPEQLVRTKGYSTTMAISTLKKLMVGRYLRRGDGIIATPESRRKERLFGETGTGRGTRLLANVKLERLRGPDYSPRLDTCLKAFVRLISDAASEEAVADEFVQPLDVAIDTLM